MKGTGRDKERHLRRYREARRKEVTGRQKKGMKVRMKGREGGREN